MTHLSRSPNPAREALRKRWSKEGWHTTASIGDQLDVASRKHPATEWLFHTNGQVVRRRIDEMRMRSRLAAAALLNAGLRRGDAIVVQLPNGPVATELVLGALIAGLFVVPLPHVLGQEEVDFILEQTGARMLVVPDRWRQIDFRSRLDDVDVEHLVVVGDDCPAHGRTWAEVLAAASGHKYAGTGQEDPHQPCLAVYTSGTTSAPKGALYTHASLLSELRRSPTPVPNRQDAVTLQPFPSGHTSSLVGVLGPIVHALPTVILESWDAQVAAELISAHSVTDMAGTPYYISTLLEMARHDHHAVRTLRDVITGGASVPPSLVEQAQEMGWTASRVYGSTEHPSITTATPADPLRLRATTDGRPIAGNQIRIVDSDGREVPKGEPGEIVAIGPEQFSGYVDSALDHDAFLPSGWLRTGDVGYLRGDGCLVTTDRIKDIVIRGGENISASQVEDVLVRHPTIREAAVVPFPDDRYGERVGAFLVLRGKKAPTPDELLQHFDGLGVARHKVPELIRTVEEMPRTRTGKIRKDVLRARLATGAEAPGRPETM